MWPPLFHPSSRQVQVLVVLAVVLVVEEEVEEGLCSVWGCPP